ncbi:MAG: potassium-transporting ATPase subunit KdpA, partial [Chromatiaceae bacterium]
MTGNGYLQIGLYLAALLLLAWPLGLYMARVYAGELPVYVRWSRSLENELYRLAGIKPDEGMTWLRYALAFLAFNLLGLLAVYALQRLQLWLPLNPQALANVTPDSAFNTAVSFATNTNWQGYGGETTMSHLTQMLGLNVQNFVSAASGMAVLVAVVRGFVKREADSIGNFWVDLVRSTLYILLPLSLILAVVLVSQGVVQTFAPSQTVELSQPVRYEKAKLDADGQAVQDAAGKPVMESVTETWQTIAV